MSAPHETEDPRILLEEARRAYRRALPRRVRAVGGAVVAWRASSEDARLRERARLLAHRLAGTAGSYGLARVGAACAALERWIVADDAPAEHVDRALEDLRRAVRAEAAS